VSLLRQRSPVPLWSTPPFLAQADGSYGGGAISDFLQIGTQVYDQTTAFSPDLPGRRLRDNSCRVREGLRSGGTLEDGVARLIDGRASKPRPILSPLGKRSEQPRMCGDRGYSPGTSDAGRGGMVSDSTIPAGALPLATTLAP
jgi:hypothetical protein